MHSFLLGSALIFSYALISCNENKTGNKSEIKALPTFRLSAGIDSLLKGYVAKRAGPAYAIFIDKKSEGLSSYRITIAPFYKKVDDLYESGAMNYFILNDSIPVFLYTGLEDFVICDSPSFSKAKELAPELSKGEFKYWEPIKCKIDFSQSWSYIYSDTLSYTHQGKITRYIVEGDSNPFSIYTLLPTQVLFQIK